MAADALIAEILRGQGAIMERLDALEKLICDDAEEDKKEGESEGPEASDMPPPNPLFSSNQLEFDIPPII